MRIGIPSDVRSMQSLATSVLILAFLILSGSRSANALPAFARARKPVRKAREQEAKTRNRYLHHQFLKLSARCKIDLPFSPFEPGEFRFRVSVLNKT